MIADITMLRMSNFLWISRTGNSHAVAVTLRASTSISDDGSLRCWWVVLTQCFPRHALAHNTARSIYLEGRISAETFHVNTTSRVRCQFQQAGPLNHQSQPPPRLKTCFFRRTAHPGIWARKAETSIPSDRPTRHDHTTNNHDKCIVLSL